MTARHPVVIPSVGVILADPRGSWTSLWRRQLSGRGIRVHSVDTLDAIADHVAARPWDLVAIVLDTFRGEALWSWWQSDRERRPAGRVCLLGGRRCEETGWGILEAGCDLWMRDPQNIRSVVGVVARHCGTVRFEHLPVTDRVQLALPWP